MANKKIVLNKKPKPYTAKHITIKTRTTPITFEYRAEADKPTADTMVDLIVEQLLRAPGRPSNATLRRRRKTKSTQMLYNTGRLIGGLAARLAGEEWTVVAPGDRLQMTGAALRRIRNMIATAIDLGHLIADHRWKMATQEGWRRMWRVGRLR
jgi:hypothetical protein